MSDDTRPTLPLDLPFDDEGDRPVPGDVPALRLVGAGDGTPDASGEPDPDDLRPAQARALRRSGMRTVTIAAAMGIDLATVEAWTADVAPGRGRRGRPTAVRPAGVRTDAARTAAARRRFAGQEAALGAGLAVAIARVDDDGGAVTLTDDRPDVVAAALDALRSEVAPGEASVRVAARCGPALAGDRVRSDLAARLGVPADRIVVGRWQGAPAADALEVSVRVADPRAVRVVDAWAAVAVPARPLGMAR
jgi:hypothetical protein